MKIKEIMEKRGKNTTPEKIRKKLYTARKCKNR